MTEVRRLALPVPYLGSVNLWLLEGEPLTLVDTGPRNTVALETLEEQLETRKVVDRAKGILMDRHGMSEGDAFDWIQRTAMDARVKAKDVAAQVIDGTAAPAAGA